MYISKQDADGKELPGASLEVRTADGELVDSWTSDGSIHSLEVQPGIYTLVETAAPQGYQLATEITFTVAEDGTVTCSGKTVTSNAPIVMVDDLEPVPDVPETPSEYPVYISKQDAKGKELAGASMEVRNADGQTVASWTSTGSTHTIEVKPGIYTLVETAAPEGYLLATEITFIVDAQGEVTCGGVTVTSDAPVVMVDELKPVPDVPEEFPVYISKQDAKGNELPGATLEVQAEDGTVLDRWISDGTIHTVKVDTGSYKLVETAAPKGYLLATSIAFTVDENGNVTCGNAIVTSDAPIVMVDDLDDTPETPKNPPETPETPENPPVTPPTPPRTPETPKTPESPEVPTPEETPNVPETPVTVDIPEENVPQAAYVEEPTPEVEVPIEEEPVPLSAEAPEPEVIVNVVPDATPNTGDSSNRALWITLLCAAALGLLSCVGYLFVPKKRKR